jgi:AcrR family transcriptional regulator
VRVLAPRPAGDDTCAQTAAIVEAAERLEGAVDTALPPDWPNEDEGDTRAKIIRAAVDLFLDVGYQNLRVDEITDRAGIGKGTFYHHFSSKQDLLLAYFRRTMELVQVAEAVAAEAQLDHLGRAAFRLRLWLERDTKWNRVVTFIRVMANSSNPEIAAAAWEAYACIAEPSRRDFEQGMTEGLVRELEPGLAALALLSMQEVLAWRMEQDDTYDRGTILAFTADVYCRAFLK